jgi:hypothetical protein
MGGIHIIMCLQDYSRDGLIHIDTVGVDVPELFMKAHQLGRIHGVGTRCNDGNGTRVVWLYTGRCRDNSDKLLPLPQPPVRARTDARTNPSAQRATQLRRVLARVYAVSIQNQITTTVP